MRVSIAVLSLGALVGACVDEPGPEPGTAASPILGGQVTPAGAFPAVGALYLPSIGAYCTGTLIRPDVVLTAAQCLGLDAREPGFTLALDAASTVPDQVAGVYHVLHEQFAPGSVLAARPEPRADPSGARSGARVEGGLGQYNDVGLLFLAAPVDGVTPEPLPAAGEASAVRQGLALTLVGYGLASEDVADRGVKHHGAASVMATNASELQTRSGAAQGCIGDSGGPALADLGNGERVVGVLSRPSLDPGGCAGGSVHTRVDAYAGWIEDKIRLGVPVREDAGPGGDGGPDLGDAGADAAGATGEGGGCCQTSGGGGGSLALALVAALALRRRRG